MPRRGEGRQGEEEKEEREQEGKSVPRAFRIKAELLQHRVIISYAFFPCRVGGDDGGSGSARAHGIVK